MVEAQAARLLVFQVQDEDIETFQSIIKKLMVAVRQPGFKKPFTDDERVTIERIAESMSIEKPDEVKIDGTSMPTVYSQ